MQLTGPAFLLAVVESRWKPARQLILGVRPQRASLMGFRVQLIAVSGKEPAAVHRDYGVAPTGRREEIPESPVVGAKLPGGAYLLYINDEIVPDDRVFARLSRGAELVACHANETVMSRHLPGPRVFG